MSIALTKQIVVYRCDCCRETAEGSPSHHPDGWIGYRWITSPKDDGKGNGYDLCPSCYDIIKVTMKNIAENSKASDKD